MPQFAQTVSNTPGAPATIAGTKTMPDGSISWTDASGNILAPDGNGGWVIAAPGQTSASPAPTTTAAQPDPSAGAVPAGVIDSSSDQNAYLKASGAIAAYKGQLNIQSIVDETDPKTNTPTGNLTVRVIDSTTGNSGNMTLGPNGNVLSLTNDDGSNFKLPTPASTTGTTAAQTQADAAQTNADTNKQKADRPYTSGGIVFDGKGNPIGMAQPTNPQDSLPKDVGGRHYEYTPGQPDENGNPQPGTWKDTGPATLTPAEQTTAGHDADLIKLQQAKNTADAAAQQATADAAKTRNDLQAKQDAWTQQYQSGELSEQQYRDQLTQANQEAQQALDRATLAVNQQKVANDAWYQQQQVGIQQGQLANQTAQEKTAEQTQRDTEQNNQNTTALQAARDLETNRSNLANETNARGQLGAQTLNDRATHATGLLNSWVNAAAGNKNFGLGGALPAGLGAGLMNDATGFATQAMGGQSVMDAASQMVHAADPSLQGTPEGAQWTATVAQMLAKMAPGQDQSQTQGQPQTPPTTTTTPANPGAGPAAAASQAAADTGSTSTAPATTDPSDPNFLGQVLGQALTHIGGFSAPTPGQRGNLTPVPNTSGVQV